MTPQEALQILASNIEMCARRESNAFVEAREALAVLRGFVYRAPLFATGQAVQPHISEEPAVVVGWDYTENGRFTGYYRVHEQKGFQHWYYTEHERDLRPASVEQAKRLLVLQEQERQRNLEWDKADSERAALLAEP